jgi:hypothetical protein
MNIKRILGMLTLIVSSSSTALAEEEGTQIDQSSTLLPSLPVFELPAQASDDARLHVGLAHARRDSQRAAHTRAGAALHQNSAQSQLAAAREQRASARTRRDVADLRRADAQERRMQAQERSAAAAEHRAVAAERQQNADALRAAAAERRANAGR